MTEIADQPTDGSLDDDFAEFLDHPGVPDPYALYRRMRTADPLHWAPVVNAWVATGYAEVEHLTMDGRWSSAASTASNFVGGPDRSHALAMIDQMVSHTDPPDHTRLRRLTNRTFSTRAAESRRPAVAAKANEVLDLLDTVDEIDFVQRIAYMFPFYLTCDLLGLPHADIPQLHEWTRIYLTLMEPRLPEEKRRAGDQMFRDFADYLAPFIAERRSGVKKDDILDDFVAAEDAGELARDELVASYFNIMVGSHETTANLIGNGLYALLSRPDQWRMLVERLDELLFPAVEEILRYCSSATNTLPRWAFEDVELGGHTVRQGDKVITCLAAANRDPQVFENAETFDISRDASDHLAFGKGKHLCLGAPFARVEAQEMFRALATRFPDLELVSIGHWEPSWTMRGLDSMIVKVRG